MKTIPASMGRGGRPRKWKSGISATTTMETIRTR